MFSTPGNPPIATAQNLLNGQLQTLGQGLSPQPVPTLITFQYNANDPGAVAVAGRHPEDRCRGRWPWTCRTWATTAINRLGSFQGGTRQLLNAVDIGAAYLPQNQDPTLGTSTIPGATAYTTNLLRPYRGYRRNRTEPAGFLGHVSLAAVQPEPAVPERVLVRRELHVWDLLQGQHGAAAAVPARGRRDDLAAVRRGGSSRS